MPTSLVTGGCGFGGGRLIFRLMQQGHDVWLSDDLGAGRDPDLCLKPVTAREQANGGLRYEVSGRPVTFLREGAAVTCLKYLEEGFGRVLQTASQRVAILGAEAAA